MCEIEGLVNLWDNHHLKRNVNRIHVMFLIQKLLLLPMIYGEKGIWMLHNSSGHMKGPPCLELVAPLALHDVSC